MFLCRYLFLFIIFFWFIGIKFKFWFRVYEDGCFCVWWDLLWVLECKNENVFEGYWFMGCCGDRNILIRGNFIGILKIWRRLCIIIIIYWFSFVEIMDGNEGYNSVLYDLKCISFWNFFVDSVCYIIKGGMGFFVSEIIRRFFVLS